MMDTVRHSRWTDAVLQVWWWLIFIGRRLLFGAQTDGGQGPWKSRKEMGWWSGSGRGHMDGKMLDGGLDDGVEQVH